VQRRCIHDEYGNVDIIKANEVPIPRGSTSKRRRVSDENPNSSAKRKKHGSSFEDDYMNGDMHARHSLPNQFSVGSSLLQDIAFSAQQALARDEDDLVPVDPALQAYANGAYSAMEMAPSYASNGNGIMSSIEQQAEGDMHGSEYATQNGGLHGPSMEPLTPGPPPHNDTAHAQSNGYTAPDPLHVKTNGFAHQSSHNNAVRRPSSPVSPRQMSAISPGMYNHNAYMTSPSMNHNHNNHDYNFTTDSDFPPPPTTPAAKTHAPANKTPRASKTPKSTPSNRHTEGIKLEAGIGVGMMMDVDMIDPSLDQASIDLIKQLQQEDLGLRRRSR
jgi:F-box/leucine-rich repeat protein 10/11